jgi:DNA-directed RNA polymerase subunit RPC12/RpoP
VFTARYDLRSAHTEYLCVLCGSENKQRFFLLYSINWLVFVNETQCVYCAVRSLLYVLPTECVYVFCVDLRTNSEYITVQH